jgi:hypothetical protein
MCPVRFVTYVSGRSELSANAGALTERLQLDHHSAERSGPQSLT